MTTLIKIYDDTTSSTKLIKTGTLQHTVEKEFLWREKSSDNKMAMMDVTTLPNSKRAVNNQ